MMDRMVLMSTVSQSGVCQSLVIREILCHYTWVEGAGGEKGRDEKEEKKNDLETSMTEADL